MVVVVVVVVVVFIQVVDSSVRGKGSARRRIVLSSPVKKDTTNGDQGGPGAGAAMASDTSPKELAIRDALIDAEPQNGKQQVMQMAEASQKVDIQVTTTKEDVNLEASSLVQHSTGSVAKLPVKIPVAKKMRITLPKGSGAPKLGR